MLSYRQAMLLFQLYPSFSITGVVQCLKMWRGKYECGGHTVWSFNEGLCKHLPENRHNYSYVWPKFCLLSGNLPQLVSELNFMQGFKSAILAELKNYWNGNFEPMHEVQKKFFDQKTSFEALRKCHILKISITCPRICQIQDLGQSN